MNFLFGFNHAAASRFPIRTRTRSPAHFQSSGPVQFQILLLFMVFGVLVERVPLAGMFFEVNFDVDLPCVRTPFQADAAVLSRICVWQLYIIRIVQLKDTRQPVQPGMVRRHAVAIKPAVLQVAHSSNLEPTSNGSSGFNTHKIPIGF